MGESSAQSFCLKILVAKEENKVIMAESNKEFMDVLFSFMVMPIASVVRHTRNCLSEGIGCLDNLYGSVENIDQDFLQDEVFRDILLNPRSAAEIYCKNLQLNLIDSGCTDFHACRRYNCKVVRYYNIGKCPCGEDMEHKLNIVPTSSRFYPEEEDGFLESTARFIITDDFKVMPVAHMADLTLLNELGKYEKIEERTIKIGKDEVLNLLKRSLISKTPLSETFLEPTVESSSIELVEMKCGPGGMNPPAKVDFQNRTKIHLKLIFDKVSNIALYAVAKEDFVNMLCTFLTIPLGYIFNQFPCLSFEGCIGNLHKSIQDTDINLFCREERKKILVNPKLAPGLAYSGNLIGIEEADIPSKCSDFSQFLDAKSRTNWWSNTNSRKQKVFDGFIKGPATFLVTDSMEVTPLSPLSVKLLVDRLMVPLSDIGEQEVILDEDKAVRLLAASLASKHALTSTFLHKETNVDCLDFLRLMWGGKGIDFKGK